MIAWSVIVVEIFLAGAHFAGVFTLVAYPLGLALLLAFLFATTNVLVRGDRIPCHCFGKSEPISYRTLLRLVALVGSEALLLALAKPLSDDLRSDPISLPQLVAALPGVCAALVFAMLLFAVPEIVLIGRDVLIHQRVNKVEKQR